MTGTIVRLFPQSEGFPEPVPVELSPPAGSVLPGPEDATLRTILPVDKAAPYAPPGYMPPWRGPVLPPAAPDAFGNFDHIPIDAPQFLSQHLYGGIRRTLDVWEHYLGRPVRWWHDAMWPQLELVPLLDWNNAHSGPGFIETGFRAAGSGETRLFALNLDVIAHETGHAMLFSEVGVPAPESITTGYLAFHESFCDLIALVNALCFPQVVARLFEQTRGNLYVLNLVSRIGELSQVEQIRVADNTTTISDVADMRLAEDGEWIDPSGEDRTVHDASLPLTGAIFDILVDLFQDNLVRARLIPPQLDARGWDADEVAMSFARLEHVAGDALAAHGPAFHAALADARDVVGHCMAQTMLTLDPDHMTFDAVAACMIRAAAGLGLERLDATFMENFVLRGIDPRPRLREAAAVATLWRGLSYAERRARIAGLHRPRRQVPAPGAFMAAGQMMPHPHRMLEEP